jgi:hypothetical protein
MLRDGVRLYCEVQFQIRFSDTRTSGSWHSNQIDSSQVEPAYEAAEAKPQNYFTFGIRKFYLNISAFAASWWILFE